MARSGSVEIPAPDGATVELEWVWEMEHMRWRIRLRERNSEWHRVMAFPATWDAEEIFVRFWGADMPGGRCSRGDIAAAHRVFVAATGQQTEQELEADGAA